MVEPISLSVAIAYLVKNAPSWFTSLNDTLIDKSKETLVSGIIDQSDKRLSLKIDEKKHLRHMELALKNAAERGLKQFHLPEDQDRYRSTLQLLSESNSQALRHEALQLFTLSDEPDFTMLAEKYNLRQRIHALAQGHTYNEIDVRPYLISFFEALIAELYNDPLFREKMSNVIKVRSNLKSQRSLEDIVTLLDQIENILMPGYSPAQFKHDLDIYNKFIESKLRHHKFSGIVFKGNEDIAPEIESVFVPLRIILQGQKLSIDQIEDNLMHLLEQSPYMVLLGGPGSGKSTTTRYFAWSHAKANLGTDEAPKLTSYVILTGSPIPLYIELRLLCEARKQRPDYSILAYTLDVILGREEIHVNLQMFTELLERRGMLLLFDGLDEVPTLDERRRLVEEIENFAQRFPGNHIIITSRPVGYNAAPFANRWFQHSLIQELNDEQIYQFLVSWYTHVLKYSSLPSEMQRELEVFYETLMRNSRLHRLANNPLLLTVMTALHRYERLPEKRVQIYEKCADLLLDTWSKLKYEGGHWKDLKMGKENQAACIAHLGFVLHKRSQENDISNREIETELQSVEYSATDVPTKFMLREIQGFLKNRKLLSGAEQGVEAERFLELVKKEAGLIVERGTDEVGESLYGFVHRTFQEYFAAVDVYERYQQEDDAEIISDFLIEHLHDPHWREVILLLFGKLKHKPATNQLRRILHGISRRSRYSEILKQDLFFVCDCLAEGISVENDFAEQVISLISEVVKTTPFLTQSKEALDALGGLVHIHQYTESGMPKLKELFTDETIDIHIRLESSLIFYLNCEGEERDQAFEQSKTLFLHPNISIVDAVNTARSFLESAPEGSNAQRQASRLLYALQSQDLTRLETYQYYQTLFGRSTSDILNKEYSSESKKLPKDNHSSASDFSSYFMIAMDESIKFVTTYTKHYAIKSLNLGMNKRANFRLHKVATQ